MKHNDLSQSVGYGYTSSSARSPYSKRTSDFNKTNDFTSKYKSPQNNRQANDSSNFLRSTMGAYRSRPTEDLYSSQARTGEVKEQFNLRNTTGNLASLMKKFDFDKEQEPTPSKKYSQKLNNINSQAMFKKEKLSYNNTYTAQSKNTEAKYDYSDKKKQNSKVYQSSSSARLDEMIKKHQKQQEIKEEIRKLREEKQAKQKAKSKGASSLTNLLSTVNFSSSTSEYSSNSSFKEPIKAKNPQNLFNSYRQQTFQDKYKDFSKKGAYDFTKKQQQKQSNTYTPKRQKQSKYDFVKKYQSDKKTSDWKMQDFQAKYQSKLSENFSKYSSPSIKQKQKALNSPSFQKKQFKTQKEVKVTKFFSFGENKPIQKFDSKVGLRDFQLGKLLGEGKFGNVYQAIHKQTKSLYALKKVPKSIIQSHYMIDQFILQLKLQAYMNHENILAMQGFFHDKEHIYLILEYMEEGTLYSILKKNKTLQIGDAAKKLKQISKGLIYMHQNGLAHRDIKPENVVMSHGVCKLCDFGWATICDQRRKTYCGTFDYAAPQILEGTQYDMTVDLWCLGVLAYELLVGKAPFYHIKKEETKKKILNVQSQKITFPSTLPRDAIDFIEKLLKKDPEQRIKVQELLQHPFLAKI